MFKRFIVFCLILCCTALITPWSAAESAPVNPTMITLAKSATVMKGRTITLTPVLTPVDATTTFTWSTSKKSVATVIGGVVTGVNPGKAVITVKTANNKKATCTVTVTQVYMTSLGIGMSDWQGDDCFYEDDETGDKFFAEVTGHRMYPTLYNVTPADANRTITWKAENSAIASVDSKGVVTGKKAGTTNIVGTAKYGGYRFNYPIAIFTNETYWSVDDCFDDLSEYDEDGCYTCAKRIYAKNGYLYVDMYFLNMYDFTIKRLSKQAVFLTLNYSDEEPDYYYVGSYKATLKGKIPPYCVGTATIKLGKVNAAKIWLTDADAYSEGYVYSKDSGAEPKAAIPGISGVSLPARKVKPARSPW